MNRRIKKIVLVFSFLTFSHAQDAQDAYDPGVKQVLEEMEQRARDENPYVYVSKKIITAVQSLHDMHPAYAWSDSLKNFHSTISKGNNVVPLDQTVLALEECLMVIAQQASSDEKSDELVASIKEYVKAIDSGDALLSFVADNASGEMPTRSCSRQVCCNLYVSENAYIKGNTTFVGSVRVDRELIVNGVDISGMAVGTITDAANLPGGTGLFSGKVGTILNFKSLVPGQNIALSNDANTVTIGLTGFNDTNGVVYFDGAELATTPPETAGWVFTSQGAGAPPIFEAGGGGGGVNSVTGGSNINISGTVTNPIVNLNNNVSVSESLAAGTSVTAGDGLTVTSGAITFSPFATHAGALVVDNSGVVASINDVALTVLVSHGPGLAPEFQSITVTGRHERFTRQ